MIMFGDTTHVHLALDHHSCTLVLSRLTAEDAILIPTFVHRLLTLLGTYLPQIFLLHTSTHEGKPMPAMVDCKTMTMGFYQLKSSITDTPTIPVITVKNLLADHAWPIRYMDSLKKLWTMTSLVTLSKSTCQTILSDSDFVYAAFDEKGTLLATLRGLHNGKSIWITETNQYAVEGISRLSPLLLKALHQDAKGIPILPLMMNALIQNQPIRQKCGYLIKTHRPKLLLLLMQPKDA